MDFPLLTANRIMMSEEVLDFPQALRILTEKLELEGYISPRYKHTIELNLEQNGPYFVLAPKIALPHSQYVEEVYHTGLSVLKVKNAIDVGGQPVKIFILLAANSAEGHLQLLAKMVTLMDTAEKQEEFVTCDFESLKSKMMKLMY